MDNIEAESEDYEEDFEVERTAGAIREYNEQVQINASEWI